MIRIILLVLFILIFLRANRERIEVIIFELLFFLLMYIIIPSYLYLPIGKGYYDKF